ncbi:hypothetical protein L596_026987 [Steinernema carpocapsae]|uniref:BHLH domain-containing protein n=1 Tax=Steinernema carpocapsae TaxID=34508 RepID=A0A4U5M350_STECR|nr:hypothetical protein L596_026987 [Steinernema carpocapsae]
MDKKSPLGLNSYGLQGPKSRRYRSNVNERKRNRDMNSAFDSLQAKMSHIPMLPPPEKQRLSKIRTLRLAFQYIDFLKRILNDQNQACENVSPPRAIEEFANVVKSELTIRNSYSERAEHEQLVRSSSSQKSTPEQFPSPTYSTHANNYEQFYDLRHPYGPYIQHHC